MAEIEATVLGGRGFIGSRIAQHLRDGGRDVWVPSRTDIETLPANLDLGDVVYAIGLTGDFRSRPLETVEAHAALLARLLHGTRWRSFLVLSSARIYGGAGGATDEDAAIAIRPSADSLYDLSKLLGESLALAHPAPTARAVRLSNIFGPGMSEATFLGSVLASAQSGSVCLGEAPQSAKDYLGVETAAALCVDVALRGTQRLYNVAGGAVISHADIAEMLGKTHGANVTFQPDAPLRRFPPVDVSRISAEFGRPADDPHAALAAFLRSHAGART